MFAYQIAGPFNKVMSNSDLVSLFTLGTGQLHDRLDIGRDLAIMSQCNHTILSHGTYSFWAGFLAGGQRIIPSMVLKLAKGSGRGKQRVLDSNLGPFHMTDKGLQYFSQQELKDHGIEDTFKRVVY